MGVATAMITMTKNLIQIDVFSFNFVLLNPYMASPSKIPARTPYICDKIISLIKAPVPELSAY